MKAACFFRYVWISPGRFEALLPATPALDGLSKHLRLGAELAETLPGTALRSGAITRLANFASNPLICTLPAHSFTRSAAAWAARHGEREAEQLSEWCLLLQERIDLCVSAEADDARDAAFLTGLANTDFPVLLLWSNPALARQIFVNEDGEIRIAPFLLTHPKARRKAAVAALRYALGSFGRFGPRGGWIGSGFAVADGALEPARIERRDERLCVEADIGWAARNWFPDETGGIVAGEDAWSYVQRKLRGRSTAADRLTTVERLAEMALSLGDRAWRFGDVDAFLRNAADCLARTVSSDVWNADPHHWWLSRVVKQELRFRSDVFDTCVRLYESARVEVRALGVVEGSSSPSNGPYPLRCARLNPSGVICPAEELTDWVLDADTVRRSTGPFLPDCNPSSGAIVIHAQGVQGRYRLHEPNPRRTADIVARHLDDAPHYLFCDTGSIAIAPPRHLSDQRLLRPFGREAELGAVPVECNAMFRYPLGGPESAAQLRREMSSPRYAQVPDLLPVLFDEGRARSVSFGRIDPVSRIWLLRQLEAHALAAQLKSPGEVASFYRMEVHPVLASQGWVVALLDGKASRLPTYSTVTFRWLLHACRTATAPIVLRADAQQALAPILTDGETPMALELYVAMPDLVRGCVTKRVSIPPFVLGQQEG